MALTDSRAHLPTADYNKDIRPGLGNTYVDAVFGETVRQLTNIGANAADDDIYSHCMANADGTLYMQYFSQLEIRYTADAKVYKSNQPVGQGSGARTDLIFHPTDPDKYFFLQHSSSRGIYQRNLAAGTSTLIKDPGFNLGTLGGSVNWVDRTGRYFLIHDSASAVYRVYDRQTDTIYTGNIPLPAAGGWGGITPSGKYVITSRTADHYTISYAINHGTQTVSTTGVRFLHVGTGHTVPVSGSDGNDYLICSDSDDSGGIWRVSVTANNNGAPLSLASHRGATKLFAHSAYYDRHMAVGPNGRGRDWAFVSTEAGNHSSGAFSDAFNAIPGTDNTWHPFKQEIIAVNYLTGELRRLAHHRSRGIPGKYYHQPRPSCSWNGSFVFWASNQNQNSGVGRLGYSDLYGIRNPLGMPGGGARQTYLPMRLSEVAPLALAAGVLGNRQRISRREFFRRSSGLLVPTRRR